VQFVPGCDQNRAGRTCNVPSGIKKYNQFFEPCHAITAGKERFGFRKASIGRFRAKPGGSF
jgi:hypothetical protein